MQYTVGSEPITFSAFAPPELRGRTEERWYLIDEAGQKVCSGMRTRAEAEEAAVLRALGEQLHPVRLADGRTVPVPLSLLHRFLGVDAHGHRVVCDHGVTYALTDCCGASGKGSAGGVVCRACYTPVAWEFGAEATVAVPRLPL